MGDSITVGVDYLTLSSGGYRDPLYRDLTAAGLSFTYVGINNSQASPTLSAAGEQFHCGFGGWHIGDIDANLNGVADPVDGGDGNNGGYILTGGNGTGRGALTPDILLLHVGTNDLLIDTPNINQALYKLVTDIHALTPNTLILIAGVIPINNTGLLPRIAAYNSYIKTQLVPSLSYTVFVDQSAGFLNPDGSVNGSLLGADDVHPNRYGYPILAQAWANAIEAAEGITPTSHVLTVSGGSGSGSYPAGSVVTLSANAPGANQQFGSWANPSLAMSNPFSPLMVYTMPPADVTVTANDSPLGSPILPNGTYEVVSNYNSLAVTASGTTSSSAVQQQTYTGTPAQSWVVTNLGNNVVSLTLSGTNVALEVPTSNVSTLGGSLDVGAYTGAANQQWAITPVTGVFDLVNQSSGQVVNVAGYSTVAGSPLLQYSPGYVDDWWVFYPSSGSAATYALTVNAGTGGGTYAAGSLVSVSANPAPAGMRFAGWTGGISGLSDASAASTTLTMPGGPDALTATYVANPALYSLTVSGGSGSGSYAAGTVVTISANAGPAGSQFSRWTGATAALASTSSATTTVTMSNAAIAVTATFTQAALAAGTSAVIGTSSTVSVQFVGGGASPLRGRGYNYTAGAPGFSAANWNSVLNTGNTTTPQVLSMSGTLINSAGALSSIGFELNSSGAYYTGAGQAFPGEPPYPGYPSQTSGAGDSFLYSGFAYAGYSDASPLTLTLRGLNPAHNYTILAYVTPFEQFGEQQPATISLGATTYALLTNGAASIYEKVSAPGGVGNYVEFVGVSGASTQTITLTNTGMIVGLSGFQVIDLGIAPAARSGAATTTLTVSGGTGSGSYAQGTIVSIAANPVAGEAFTGWTGNTSVLANPQASSTTATLGASSVTVVATYAPASTSPSTIVSIQFVGGGAAPLHGSFFDYTAGAFSAGHWNPLLLTGNTTAPQNLTVGAGLTDSNGAASDIGLTLVASGAYYTGAGSNFTSTPAYPGVPGRPSGPGDGFLYRGFAFAGYSNDLPLTFSVTGLNPANTYSILVYVTPFESFGDGQTATVALMGGPVLNINASGSAGSYQRATGAQAGSAAGNYVEFDGLTGSATQTITFTNTSQLVGVSGIQVVNLGPQ